MTNVAFSPPPETISVNGSDYPAQTDYRVWLEVSELLDEVRFHSDDMNKCIKTAARITVLVFGKLINAPVNDILNAVVTFYKGYPKPERAFSAEREGGGRERVFSFKHDINYIILAIRNQSGIDLSYRRTEPFHWWNFLLEFETLEEHHYISRVMSYRAYSGDNKDMLKLKQLYALPEEYTRDELEMLDEFNALFSGC